MRRVLLAAVALSLAGCGLDFWPYLEPPGDPSEASPGTPLFYVLYQVTTVQEFRGFEVYYKFYSSDQSRQTSLTTLEQLTAAGFHRMCSPGTLSMQGLPFVPLIPVDWASEPLDFQIVLDFTLSDPPYMDYQGVVPPAYDEIRRTATDTQSNTKTFELSELDESDVDLTDVNWDQVDSDKQLFLVIYALSYGLKDISIPLYSTARYLGYMEYTGVP
jgi:hypothetical protein